jgi:23S rRNA G2069 N7-methylase RlmK/C1962 C5-methylase RlmI
VTRQWHPVTVVDIAAVLVEVVQQNKALNDLRYRKRIQFMIQDAKG